MNRIQFKKHWIKIGAISSAGYILLLALLALTVLKPQLRKLDNTEKDIQNMKSKLKEYSDFKNTMSRLEAKKKKVEDVITEFRANLILPEEIQQRFLAEIGKITREAGIRAKEINSVGVSSMKGYAKHIWSLSFQSSYKKLINFIYLLECNPVFFGVENFSISSGKEKAEHSINMNIYTAIPIAVNTDSSISKFDIHKSTVILSLPANTYKMAMNIKDSEEAISDTKASKLRKDPMYLADTIFPEWKKDIIQEHKPEKSKKTPPKLSLDGIIWDTKDVMAVINGELVKNGDSIKGARIIKITQTTVTLKWESQYIKLELK
ncbi:hypothetical protein ACFLUV_07025 [Elusimicrobiota bacterium]